MSDPYIKVYCSKETKIIFDSFYEQNKGIFGTKANMFRVMVSNLPVLANQSNVRFSDPENKKLEQKISEIESLVVGKLDELDQKLSYSLKNKCKTEEREDV